MPPEQWLSGVDLESKLPPNIGPYVQAAARCDARSVRYIRGFISPIWPCRDKGGVLGVPNAKAFFWKEFSGFISPYDLRGQVFITYRYADFHQPDDSWIYDPISRRVRRFSAEEKSDSFMGTDETLNDFYSFSGHVLDWNGSSWAGGIWCPSWIRRKPICTPTVLTATFPTMSGRCGASR